MNQEELSFADNDIYLSELCAQEPSINLDFNANPSSYNEVSNFLKNFDHIENVSLQYTMDQLEPNYETNSNIADLKMNDPLTFGEENDVTAKREPNLYSLNPEPTNSPLNTFENKKELNASEYRDKRERNNIAVRKSRSKAKFQRDGIQKRVSQLKEENKELEEKIKSLQEKLQLCKKFIIEKGSCIPPN
ncbi:CCAAT/enhancer-binding protein epsilon-like [Argonauta hians]